MADSINTINVGGIDKEVEDTVARNSGTNANSRCTTLESDVSNLAARVEEIIAPTGEAPNPAEILDARVGADNTVYDTLGKAIRGQITNTEDFIEQLRSDLIDNVKIIPQLKWNTGFMQTDGTINTTNTWNYAVIDVDDIMTSFDIKGYGWYNSVQPYILIDDDNNIVIPDEHSGSTPAYYSYNDVKFKVHGKLYINRYQNGANVNLCGAQWAYSPIDMAKYVSLNFTYNLLTTGNGNKAYKYIYDLITPDTVYDGMLITGKCALESYANQDYKVAKFLVTPFTLIKILGCAQYSHTIYAFYDANDNAIEKYTMTGSSFVDYDGVLEVPPKAEYIMVAYYTVRMSGGAFNVEISSFGSYVNKTWIAVGDSLTSYATLGAGVDIYLDYACDKLGFNVINKGEGGTGYANGIATNTAFYQRIAAFTEPEPNLITIFGSLNDLSSGLPLGTKNDNTNSSICGCINLALDAVYSKYPNAILGVILPTPWSSSYNQTVAYNYVNALRDICEMRNIPCLDLFRNSNLYPWDAAFRSAYYKAPDDGVHPNSDGHKRIAAPVIEFIKSILLV